MLLIEDIYFPSSGVWEQGDLLIDGESYLAVGGEGSIQAGRGLFGARRKDAGMVVPGSVDGKKRYVLPAGVDPHVHVREPGDSHKEDWTTCSRAALRGGCTAILDMPNNRVPVTGLDALKEKKNIALRKSLVDFGLYVALTEENGEELSEPRLQECICGVKVYYAQTTGDILVRSDRAVLQAFRQPSPVLVHAGGAEGLDRLLQLYRKARNSSSHTPVLYICHLGTAEEVAAVKKAKRDHPGLRAEVTPHHLLLTAREYTGPPRVLPPLGSERDREALWEGVADGTIDTLGSDHAPHTQEEKRSADPPAGFPGLETALPLLFHACMEGRLSLSRFIDLTSGAAAALFHLPSRQVSEGGRASFVIMEEAEYRIGEQGYSSKCGWSPFHGWKLGYRPVITVQRGRIACREGRFIENGARYLCGRKDA